MDAIGAKVITRQAKSQVPAGTDGIITAVDKNGALWTYLVSIGDYLFQFSRRDLFIQGVDPQYEREMERRTQREAEAEQPIIDRKLRMSGSKATNVKHANYGWSPADLELMRIAKERYGIPSDVETLRLGLVALVSGEWPKPLKG